MRVRLSVTEWRKGCSNSMTTDNPGTCKECTEGMVEAVTKEADRLEAQVARLRAAIGRYLDKPGCNIPAQQTAMAKLRFEMEREA